MSKIIILNRNSNMFAALMPEIQDPSFVDDTEMLDYQFDHTHVGTPSKSVGSCGVCGKNTVIECRRCNAHICNRCLCESTCFPAKPTEEGI